jgi:membrane-bound serine protease (ClpP class)
MALVGAVGRARTPLTSDPPGQIDVRGEIWRATSRTPITAGHRVRVLAISGLTLLVEPVDESTHKGDETWKA